VVAVHQASGFVKIDLDLRLLFDQFDLTQNGNK
jgi:hypothetical protein